MSVPVRLRLPTADSVGYVREVRMMKVFSRKFVFVFVWLLWDILYF